MKPIFFATPAEWRAWLEENHAGKDEVLLGFHKKASGLPSMTWSESVDQALCFGWIDGVRRKIDATSYSIRFTPRRTRSTWSAVNLKKVEELIKQGLMHPAGRAAFEKRSEERSKIYSYERANAKLGNEYQREFRANERAWAFWESQPSGYRGTATWWVISAKQEATRRRRLAALIDVSANGRRIDQLAPPTGRT
ncbi:MAG: YdeI/OmpD-associated family protein [Actinomycetota bacterium]